MAAIPYGAQPQAQPQIAGGVKGQSQNMPPKQTAASSTIQLVDECIKNSKNARMQARAVKFDYAQSIKKKPTKETNQEVDVPETQRPGKVEGTSAAVTGLKPLLMEGKEAESQVILQNDAQVAKSKVCEAAEPGLPMSPKNGAASVKSNPAYELKGDDLSRSEISLENLLQNLMDSNQGRAERAVNGAEFILHTRQDEGSRCDEKSMNAPPHELDDEVSKGVNGPGKFRLKYADGGVYEGEAVDNVRVGHGRMKYATGEIYIGKWRDNLRNGHGTLYTAEHHIIYEGCWQNDYYSGEGVLFNIQKERLPSSADLLASPQKFADALQIIDGKVVVNYQNFEKLGRYWTQYSGNFKRGQRHGNGTWIFDESQQYVGQFAQDKVYGFGKFTSPACEVKGNWINNKLITTH
jgi:hypothetical protein